MTIHVFTILVDLATSPMNFFLWKEEMHESDNRWRCQSNSSSILEIRPFCKFASMKQLNIINDILLRWLLN